MQTQTHQWDPNALLECVRASQTHVYVLQFFFFLSSRNFFDFSCVNSVFMHCSWVPQNTLFSNLFIKNGSHDTIHTFKNYFATVFFSFQFQFSAVSKRTLIRSMKVSSRAPIFIFLLMLPPLATYSFSFLQFGAACRKLQVTEVVQMCTT